MHVVQTTSTSNSFSNSIIWVTMSQGHLSSISSALAQKRWPLSDLEFVIVVGHLEIFKPTHLCINISSKGLSPNLWMWKPIRVLGLLRLLEDSSVAPVALLFHLVEGLVSNKWITRSLLVEVVVVNNKIFALMSC